MASRTWFLYAPVNRTPEDGVANVQFGWIDTDYWQKIEAGKEFRNHDDRIATSLPWGRTFLIIGIFEPNSSQLLDFVKAHDDFHCSVDFQHKPHMIHTLNRLLEDSLLFVSRRKKELGL